MIVILEPELRLVDKSSFSKLLGVKTVTYEKGEVVLELKIQEHHLNGIKTVHGGVTATLIDNIIGATITSLVQRPSTTINLNISYLSPLSSGVLTAKAKILHLGYKIVTGEGVITDQNGKMIAKGTGTFKILHTKQEDSSCKNE
ncbi:PaaI family thioesterase [Metabacillus litoralis]|uniref:PaaI family thioesterase n=1 Tax=Metabacillus TaxID=2675233 RepID=UPI000EF5B5F3|nr:PaaI family thioesterase [Metabacillus litoralis]MCM3164036.1 PaaI family thioesterase [Metabacillus litoralis]MCM3410526.1 PaaI family thioesterase [Metabacillus litoralis]UHA58381.1 PaaI family thioesterase [Metabacillus litoralis]